MSLTRRRYVAACAIGALAGCTRRENGTGDDPDPGDVSYADEVTTPRRNGELTGVDADWPSFQYDARNRGHNPLIDRGPGTKVQVAWQTEAASGRDALVGAPALSDGVVYVTTTEGLAALDAHTGREQWRTPVPGIPRTGPAIGEGRVFVGTESHVVGVDATSGGVEWRRPLVRRRDLGDYDRRGVRGGLGVSNGRVFAGTVNGIFFALSADTGAVLWDNTAEALPDETTTPSVSNLPTFNGPPGVAGDTVIIGNDNGRVYAFDAATGKPVWEREVFGAYVQLGPTVDGDTVYVNSQVGLAALSVETGAVRWRFSEDPGSTNDSPVVDDTIYLASGPSFGSLSVVALDPDDRSIAWRAGGRPHASASAGPEFLYVPLYGGLVAIDRSTGEIAWELETKSVASGPPVVTNGAVIVADEWGTVYGIGSYTD